MSESGDSTDKEIVDKLIRDIIRIEKRHLYGLESSSKQKRRDEIYEYLNKVFQKV